MIRKFVAVVVSLGFIFANSVIAQSEAVVSGSLNDSGFIVLSGNDVELFGVDLKSDGGLLVPVPSNDGSPFGFLLQNEPGQITYGSLNTSVILSGKLTLSAGYQGDIFGDDLVGQWGGPELDGPISFPVSPPVVPDPVVPDPIVPDPVVPDPIVPDPVVPDPIVPDPVIPAPNPVVPEPNASLLALFGFLAVSQLVRRKRPIS